MRAVGDPYPGAFTWLDGEKLVVWEAELVGAAPYLGLPGQAQAVGPEGVLVRCGDGGHVRLRTVQREGGPRLPAAGVVRLHARLGMDPAALHDMLRREGGP